MADTSIEGAPFATSDLYWGNGIWGPFWTTDLIGVVSARRTTDGGASWSGQIDSALAATMGLAAWFDKQTPGDTGVIVHVASANDSSGQLEYQAFNVSTGAWGSAGNIIAFNPSATAGDQKVYITKTRNGNIVAGAVRSATASVTAKAASPYTSWSSIANPFESNANDMVLACSVNTGDGADAGIIFWDISADAISIKVYDDSANTWTETAIAASHVESPAWRQMWAATRLSDGHVLLL